MVGRIGTLLGAHGVNIATMSLSRNQAGGRALTVLNLDTTPPPELLAEIATSDDIHSAQVVGSKELKGRHAKSTRTSP